MSISNIDASEMILRLGKVAAKNGGMVPLSRIIGIVNEQCEQVAVPLLDPDDFPLFKHLMTLEGTELAKRGFERAQSGEDDALYEFAMGLVTFLGASKLQIPGATPDMLAKTQESVLDLMRDLAPRSKNAAEMVRYLSMHPRERAQRDA
jgi:hypothetical protein